MTAKYVIERFYPVVTSIVVTGTYYYGERLLNAPSDVIGKAVDNGLLVSGTLIGFLLTILTVISALSTSRMKFLNEAGAKDRFGDYMRQAIILNLFAMTLFILYPVITSIAGIEQHLCYLRYVVVFTLTWTWLTSIRFALIFLNVI